MDVLHIWANDADGAYTCVLIRVRVCLGSFLASVQCCPGILNQTTVKVFLLCDYALKKMISGCLAKLMDL